MNVNFQSRVIQEGSFLTIVSITRDYAAVFYFLCPIAGQSRHVLLRHLHQVGELQQGIEMQPALNTVYVIPVYELEGEELLKHFDD